MSTEWTQALRASASDGESAGLPAVAIDGKSVRGAAAGGNPRPHLLGAATHDGAIVIAQRQIPDKGSEIGELAALVAELDLAGTVVTSMRCTPSGPPPNTSSPPRTPTTS